jgi:hypothetical protein
MAATRCLALCRADLTRRASPSIRLVEIVDALHRSAVAERTTTEEEEVGKRRYGVSLGRLSLAYVGPAFVAAA